MTTLSFVLCITSMVFYIHISGKPKRLNKLTLVNILLCCLVYFINSGHDVFLFFLVLLNSSSAYCNMFKNDINKSKEFVAFIDLFKEKIPSEEYQVITKRFFSQSDKMSSYNRKVRWIILAINITSLIIALFTVLREHYGL